MQMHDLNNTQLILLALLVSFVTSIATGIVTVTLLDQAPPAVTQTINRVVERTVEVVVPSKNQPPITQTIVVKEEEFITKAAEKNASNIVEIGRLKKRSRIGGIGRPPTEEYELELLGTAFALNKTFIASQYKVISDTEGLVIRTTQNHIYRAEVVLQDFTHNIMLFKVGEQIKSAEGLEVNAADAYAFAETPFAEMSRVQIGQTAIALGVGNGVVLSLGVISQVQTKGGTIAEDGTRTPKELVSIHTTIEANKRYAGGPLININGEILGINIIADSNEFVTVPIHLVKDAMVEAAQKKAE
ncbi:MAG: trypsin-like peptidase domain-containing protein [Parcubacteria group bacterium]|nr:trypsin-like peptidase domain-containing protein [Parcubacteria group bacterium]